MARRATVSPAGTRPPRSPSRRWKAHYHRSAAPFWYLGAAAIADSRVTLRRHYPRDVIAGGILGIGVALLETAAPRGLVLSPFIRRDHRGSGGDTRLMTSDDPFLTV